MLRFPRFITTIIFFAVSFSAYAQNENSRAAQYIAQYKQLAIDEMVRTGIPASITLAQGILETGGGQSDLASMANNHFGIKCKSEWTGETMLHDDDAKNECFRKYPDVESSYRDHSEFLKLRPNYAFLFKLDPTDYEGWAKGLKKAGYATNPSYPQRLMKIIVENNLQDVTMIALQQINNKETNLFALHTEAGQAANDEPEKTIKEEKFAVSSITEKITVKQEVAKKSGIYPKDEVFTINDTRVIYTRSGTSLLALANNYNIGLKKLLEYNELNEVDIINNDQLIFLQKKPKKGSKEIHVVETNESLHDICQKEGIQLESLMEYNRLQKGMEPATGENIYLKYLAPNSPRLASNNRHSTENSMR